MPESPHHVRAALAYLRALREPGTYDFRGNVGLWLGLVLALPIPVMAIALSAPLHVVLVSLVAPIGWSVIVGAATQVGTIREDLIRRLRFDALEDAKLREEKYAQLRSEAASERTQREKLASVLTIADAELALAKVVHEGLISEDIESDDVTVVIRHTPHAYVGGDYVQVSRPRPDLLYLCIADVAGHGVAAALVVSRLHALVLRLIQEETGAAEFLTELDRAALELLRHTSLFVTAAVFMVDMASHSIEYGTAGHPAQTLLHSGSAMDELFTPNAALGLQLPMTSRACVTKVVAYEPGDTLLLFTDGLYEVMGFDDGGEYLGEDGLKSHFAGMGELDSDAAADRILEAVRAYRGARLPDDDVSLVVARLGRRKGGATSQD
mgnify:CR=1 FL=1